MNNNDPNSQSEAIKKKMEEIRLKRELLQEIYDGLQDEEKDTKKYEKPEKPEEIKKKDLKPQTKKPRPTTIVSIKAYLKMATHALKYAHNKIPRDKWVEVFGILSGKLENKNLVIEDAYPLSHGKIDYVQVKNPSTIERAYYEIHKKKEFVCGWYHSHPAYKPFISDIDFFTQAAYQKQWKGAVALVIDPYQIDGTMLGFKIFSANLRTKEWFPIPSKIRGNLDIKTLPELLDFIRPLIDGKAVFLEYDEE